MMTNNTIRRRALLAATSTLLLLTAAACGTGSPSSETTPTTTESSPLDYDGPTTPPAPTATPYITPTAPLPPATARPNEQPGTPGRSGMPRGLAPAAAKPDRGDPTAVAAAFSLLLTTYDPRIDNQPADAGRRAAALAAGTLAAELKQPPPGGNPGLTWTELEQHKGYMRCTASDATEAGAPRDSPKRASRAVRISCTPTGDNWTGTPQVLIVFIEMSRSQTGWLVHSYTVQ